MKKEKFAKRFFASKVFLFFSLAIFGFLLFSFGEKIIASRQIDKEIKAVEENIARLESQSREFSKLLNYLGTNEFVEQEARLKFNLRKPGESVAILPEIEIQNEKENNLKGDGTNTGVQMNNPKKWWKYFFGNLN